MIGSRKRKDFYERSKKVSVWKTIQEMSANVAVRGKDWIIGGLTGYWNLSGWVVRSTTFWIFFYPLVLNMLDLVGLNWTRNGYMVASCFN